MNLNIALGELIQIKKSLRHKHQTIKTAKSSIGEFIKWSNELHGVTESNQITASILQQFQSFLANKVNTQGLPIKSATINNAVSLVKIFLRHLYDQDYIRKPLEKHLQTIREPSILPTSVLSHKEIKKLFKQIDMTTNEGYQHKAILELLYSSGIRISELCNLTIDDVNLKDGHIKVYGKFDKERLVPISKSAEKSLENYLRAIRPFMMHNSRALFLNKKQRIIKPKSIRKFLNKYAKSANIKIKVTPHTFRRSFCSELIRDDANLYHVKEMLGHSSLHTLKRYTKLNINDLKKTLKKHHPREKDN